MMKAEFVALYSLLDKHRVNDQENKTVLNNSELSFRPVHKTNFFDIQTWLDVISIYISI